MTKVNWIFLQSFRDDQLRFFNRDHDAATGIKAIGTENANKYSIVSLEKSVFRIRIIWPDPHQETLIWIRVPKKNRDKLAYKSTKIIKI